MSSPCNGQFRQQRLASTEHVFLLLNTLLLPTTSDCDVDFTINLESDCAANAVNDFGHRIHRIDLITQIMQCLLVNDPLQHVCDSFDPKANP